MSRGVTLKRAPENGKGGARGRRPLLERAYLPPLSSSHPLTRRDRPPAERLRQIPFGCAGVRP